MRTTAQTPDRSLDLFAVRSLLFLPASNSRAIAKAREAGADLVILDLEDAVKPDDKRAARAAAVEAVGSALAGAGGDPSQRHRDRVALARCRRGCSIGCRFRGPSRAISAHLVHGVAEAVAKPVLAMIETAAGVLAGGEIAHATAGLIAGTNDLRSDLRLPLDATREPISASLQMIVLAARAAGVAAFDGVFNGLDDADFLREAEEGRRLGFDGKSLIHPATRSNRAPRLCPQRGGTGARTAPR